MGGNLSQDQEGTSNQTQQPTSPPRSQTTIPQTTSTTSNNNNANIHNINNNGSNTKLEKKSSFQKSQPTLNVPTPPKNIEATNNNSKAKQEDKVLVNKKLPHNYEVIVKESDSPLNISSPEKLYERLYHGVYLNGRKKKYWVEKKGHINCFMVFAPGLSITWSGDNRYWQWHNVETSEGKTTIAVLKNVCWLEVNGKLNTANLTPGVTYQVAYILKFEYTSYGWDVPVNLRLILPNGTKQDRKENFNDKQRDEWVRIPIGEFKASQDNVGEIEFSLYEYEGGNWKSGLVIKGVAIEPKLV